MRALPRFLTKSLAVLAALGLVPQPVMAQSILRDAETEALLHELSTPLVDSILARSLRARTSLPIFA